MGSYEKIGLRQIETFYYAARLGSFTRAAQAMRVSQPTVSEHIAHLERTLGIALFDRAGRKVVLTEAGHVYYDYCQKIVRTREDAQRAVEELRGLMRGRFALRASNIPGEYLLPPLMMEFHRKFPQIDLVLEVSDSRGVEEGVSRGEVHLGFMGGKPRGADLEAFEFAGDEIVVVAAAGTEWAGGSVRGPEELRELPFVVREEGSGTQAAFDAALSEALGGPIRRKPAAVMGSTAALIAAVKAGFGVGAVSRVAVETELEAGRLVALDVGGIKLRRKFWVVYRRRGATAPAAREFMALLRKRGHLKIDAGRTRR